jgi:hypothetical protein
LIDSTPSPERRRLARRLGGASPGLALRGVEWFTALGYRHGAVCLVATA